MKMEYIEPSTTVIRIAKDYTMLTASRENIGFGDPTDHLDAPRRRRFGDFEDDECE